MFSWFNLAAGNGNVLAQYTRRSTAALFSTVIVLTSYASGGPHTHTAGCGSECRTSCASTADVKFARSSPNDLTGRYMAEVRLTRGVADSDLNLAYELEAYSGVVPSVASDVKVSASSVAVAAGVGEATGVIDLQFAKPDGEYILKVRVQRKGETIAAVLRNFIVRDGLVYDGANFEDAVSRIVYANQFGKSAHVKALAGAEAESYAQAVSAAVATRDASLQPKASPTGKGIANNETVTLKAQWRGIGPSGNIVVLPIRNARVQIADRSNGNNVLLNTWLNDNGEVAVTFTGENLQIDFYLWAEFQGFSGKNRFRLFSNNGAADNNAASIGGVVANENDFVNSKFTYTAPDPGPLGSYSRLGSAWSVYHAFRDIYRVAGSEMKIEDSNVLNIIYAGVATDGSLMGSFVGNARFGYGAYINQGDRFDWAVSAHELGHAINNTYGVLSAVGGNHNGGNQYNVSTNTGTFQNKQQSVRLAFSEGFATWWGVSLLEKSEYKGILRNVGEKAYRDSEDRDLMQRIETQSAFSTADGSILTAATGEDTECAVACFLWDLYDSGEEKFTGTGTEDQCSLGLAGVWNLLKNKGFSSGISSLVSDQIVPAGDFSDFSWFGSYVTGALVQSGMSPILNLPADKARIDIFGTPNTPLTFSWAANTNTGNVALTLNDFMLVIFDDNMSEVLFQKSVGTATSYALTSDEKTILKGNLGDRRAATAVVFGRNNGSLAASGQISTGWYPSNTRRLNFQDVNRFAVIVSAGSDAYLDPHNYRQNACKKIVNELISKSEARPDQAPDKAAFVCFTNNQIGTRDFMDPDALAPYFDVLHHQKGTVVASAIAEAINKLDDLANGFPKYDARNRGTIYVFQDYPNEGGGLQTLLTVLIAYIKGYRVQFMDMAGSSHLLAANEQVDGVADIPEKLSRYLSEKDVESTEPTTLQGAVALTGGSYMAIGDGSLQMSSVVQSFANGFANIDGGNNSGGRRLVGLLPTYDTLTTSTEIRSYAFDAQEFNQAMVGVAAASFRARIWITDRDGAIVVAATDTLGVGYADVSFTPNYSGTYMAHIESTNDAAGAFSISAQVPTSGIGVDLAPSFIALDSKFRRSRGQFNGLVRFSNIGTVDTKATTAHYYLTRNPSGEGGMLLRKALVPALSNGATKDLPLNLRVRHNVSLSGKYLVVKIDPNNSLREANKANNTAVIGPLP